MANRRIEIGRTESHPLSIDLMTLVDTRLLVQANSGGGKSGTLRLIAERASPHIQTIILDNDGEFATLREKVDMLLIGEGGEVPATVRSAGLLARRLLEAQVSAVVDMYEMGLNERRDFVAEFLKSLISLPRSLWRPTLIGLDEAHLYAPQSGEESSSEWVAALLAQGRKRGYCAIVATQRLSKLHKDVAAECNNVLIGRTWLDVDQKRAGDILGMSKADSVALRDLPPQTFYGFGPAFSVNGVFKMRTDDVATTMPKAGHRFDVAVPPPSSKVRSILAAEFANLPAEAEEQARDLTDARRKIVELQRQLQAKPSAAPSGADLLRAKTEGKRESDAVWKATTAALEAARRDDRFRFERLRRLLAKLAPMFSDFAKELSVELPDVKMPEAVPVPPSHGHATPSRPLVREVARRVAPSNGSSADGELPRGEKATLIVCAQYPDGATREQMTVLTGYKRSTRDAYIQRLRERGYVDVRGELILATDEGVAALGSDFEPLPVGADLRAYWLAKLPGGERAVLQVLIDAHPDAVERSEIDKVTGFKRSTRDAYLQRLQVKRLVTSDRGEVRASELLF